MISPVSKPRPGGGVTRMIFWWDVQPEIWNPYPYLRIFLAFFSVKKQLIWLFFWNFCKSGPISKGFSTSNMADFSILCEMDSLLRIFWPKLDPCLRTFSEKVTHLGGTFLYALTCEYHFPPPTQTFEFPSPTSKTIKLFTACTGTGIPTKKPMLFNFYTQCKTKIFGKITSIFQGLEILKMKNIQSLLSDIKIILL